MPAGLLARLLRKNGERKPAGASLAPLAETKRLLLSGSCGAPFPLLACLIDSFRSETSPSTLIFGDSVMERVSRHDGDRRTLGEMIVERLAGDGLVLSRSALHPGLARVLIEACAKLPNRPGRIVIPINLRCFSPQWQRNPAWRLTQEIAAVRAWLQAPEQPPAAIADVVETEGFFAAFDAEPVHYPLSRHATVGAFRQIVAGRPESEAGRLERAREIFVFHYTHPLADRDERLEQLGDCLELSGRLGIAVLAYVTPINCVAGVRAVGPAFMESVRANVAQLRRRLSSRCRFIDWSDALDDACFFHEDLATEHLNESGRRALAERVAEAVAELPRGA